MTRPDPDKCNADPVYLRGIIAARGHTQVSAASAIGIAPRSMRRYLSLDKETYRKAPYPVVYAIEQLPRRRVIALRSRR